MASPFSLSRPAGNVDADQYRATLADMMKRYGGDRDRAVRSANVASGFGNSTAQRFMGQGGGGKAAAAPSGGGGGGKGGGGKTDRTKTSSTSPSVPIPRDRTEALIQPPSLPGQDQLAGVPPDLMGLPGYDQLKGIPPDLIWDKDGMRRGNPPMNPALSMASVLRSVPPELVGGGGRDFGFTNTSLGQGAQAGPMAAGAGRMAQNAVSGSGVSPDGRIHFNPFKVEPQDPNESWWRAMLRG